MARHPQNTAHFTLFAGDASMSSHPTIAWITPGTRRLLESYAEAEKMVVEEAAGQLVHDRLRELKVSAPPSMPEPVPAVAGPPSNENLRAALRARPVADSPFGHERRRRR
jgi:hypothetical protein